MPVRRPAKPTAKPTSTQANTPETVVKVSVQLPTQGNMQAYDHGTGVLLKNRVVLTAGHVVDNYRRGRVFVTFWPNTRRRVSYWATVLKLNNDPDVAFLRVDRVPAGISGAVVVQAAQGTQVITYGMPRAGPVRRVLRRILRPQAHHMIISQVSYQGESGGPVMTSSGQVVGVVWGSNYGVTYCTPAATILRIGGGLCRPPTTVVVPTRPNPPRVSPQTPSSESVAEAVARALEPRFATIEARLEALESRAPATGPTGPRGRPGDPGRDGKDGKDGTSPDPEAITQRVVEIIKQEPEPTPALSHYVLVADRQASYWGRIESVLGRAREAYHPIRSTGPPSGYSGPMPQLVAYSAGSPIARWQGQYEVEQQLTRIARGEADQFSPKEGLTDGT